MTWPQHITGRLLWLVAGLVLASAAWRAFSPTQPDKADAWLKVGDKYRWTVRGLLGQRATADAATKRVTALYVQAQRHSDSTTQAYHDAIAALPQGTPGREILVLKERCDDALAGLQRTLQLCAQRGDSLQQWGALNFQLYEGAAPRLAQADSIIAANQKAGQCRFLVFKCPSRSRVAEVFFVIGVGAGVALTR